MKDGIAAEDVIKPILKKLNSFSTDIRASAVMTRDGHSLATVMGSDVKSTRLGAMCSTLLSLGEKASLELSCSSLRMLLIHGEDGYVVLMRIGEKAVLTVVSRADANLGKLLVEAKKAVTEIAALSVI